MVSSVSLYKHQTENKLTKVIHTQELPKHEHYFFVEFDNDQQHKYDIEEKWNDKNHSRVYDCRYLQRSHVGHTFWFGQIWLDFGQSQENQSLDSFSRHETKETFAAKLGIPHATVRNLVIENFEFYDTHIKNENYY